MLLAGERPPPCAYHCPVSDERLAEALRQLEERADPAFRDQLGPRYGIHTERAWGVPMSEIRALGKRLGRDHALALMLWDTGVYEGRHLAGFVDEPALVSAEQMDAWASGFDTWAIVDSICFNLFDRTPRAWDKVHEWASRDGEMVKRAAFALLWSLANHDRTSPDERFSDALPLIERAASDDRHLVSKAMNMALRAISKRRPSLTPACVDLAQRLSSSSDPAARRVGRPALKELQRASSSGP
jgi:3-methyladenine DNA glycosylase AlkD